MVFVTGQREIERIVTNIKSSYSDDTVRALPLYSLLPTDQQMRVFETVPEDVRLVVVATNIAETSLTIPNIRYVVDAGRVKQKVYDPITGLSSFEVVWISKASARQRAGRAGRTQKGHCYRLYSSAVFDNEFPEFSEPEIRRIPIEGVVLMMKTMGIDRLRNFPFPTKPDDDQLLTSMRSLQFLSAIDPDVANPEEAAITPLGRTLSFIPVAPRFGKMLAMSKQGGCMPYVIAIVASLSVQHQFLIQSGDEKDISWVHPLSDLLTSLKAIGAYSHAVSQRKDMKMFCQDHGLHLKSMREIQDVRNQLTQIMKQLEERSSQDEESGATNPTEEAEAEEISHRSRFSAENLELTPPSKAQSLMIRQIITAGFVDRIARREVLGPPLLDSDGNRYLTSKLQLVNVTFIYICVHIVCEV